MTKKSWILVIFQILAMVFLILVNKPIVDGVGVIIQILGGLVGFWGILAMRIGNFNIQPEVKSETLIQSGPYKWIRNPMYTALILVYLPIILQNFHFVNILVFLFLLIILLIKILSEEQFLEERFGEDYIRYKSITKRLIPFLY